MIVYGSSLSPFVRKVLAFGAEKGIALENRPLGPGAEDPEFMEASPFRKIPALRDGDFSVCDSSAIVHYLEAKFPEPALIPAAPEARARTIWYEEFADTILMGCGAKMFFNRIVSPRFFGRPGDLGVADKAEREELPPILDYLEKVAPGPDAYLVGDGLTLADIAVASPFANLSHLDIPADPERHPRLAAYVERILGRPSFAPWLEKERTLLARTAA
ncbi:MAG: glutathione S-transferase family protein [Alphaproteobacteria bacterium]|nr:glutathione S-transferase family protein [Alphaproteobacteria bacterium]MBV9371843.1 glutathione S-transferase family protein [Alphaproteobacteria bacterium]MBV9901290.1 glutathione S-transferase family protein [Alphaproteobacteria bacterium]